MRLLRPSYFVSRALLPQPARGPARLSGMEEAKSRAGEKRRRGTKDARPPRPRPERRRAGEKRHRGTKDTRPTSRPERCRAGEKRNRVTEEETSLPLEAALEPSPVVAAEFGGVRRMTAAEEAAWRARGAPARGRAFGEPSSSDEEPPGIGMGVGESLRLSLRFP